MQLILSLNTPTTRKSTAYEPLYFDKNAKVPYFKKKKTTFEDFSVATAALKTNPTVFDFKCQSALREVDRGTPTSAYKYE